MHPTAQTRLIPMAFTLAALTLSAAAAHPATAQTVQVTATGTFTSVFGAGLLDNSVAVGTPFTVSYEYQLQTPDQYPTDPTTGLYNFLPPSGLTAAFGDYALSPAGTTRAAVSDQPGGSTLQEVDLEQYSYGLGDGLTSTNPSAPAVGQVQSMLTFRGYTGSLLSSDALPGPALYDLNNYSPLNALFTVYVSPPAGTTGATPGAYGSLTTLSARVIGTAVPESSPCALLALGLLPVGLLLRARRQHPEGRAADQTF